MKRSISNPARRTGPNPHQTHHTGYGDDRSPTAHEVRLRDPSGRLRLPAYILIALVIAVAAILLVSAGLLLAPS